MSQIKYKLIDLDNCTFFVKFKDNFDMSMSFLRYQEYQESPKFAGKKFTITEFMAWYTKETDPEERKFTYVKDWAGFNIPTVLIGKVGSMIENDDWNEYDQAMLNIYEEISYTTMHDIVRDIKFDPASTYLISARPDYKGDRRELIMHELAHAMYYLDDEYKRGCERIFKRTDKKLIKDLSNRLIKKGYLSQSVIIKDEIQAFLTTDTGKPWFFDDISEKRLKSLRSLLKELHGARFKEFISEKQLARIL
jgi:hypothetical protein